MIMSAILTLASLGIFSLYLIYKFYKADADLTLLLKEKFGKPISSLHGKVVWITGASSGIGEYLAYELAKCKAKLVLSGTNVENLEKVKCKCIEIGSLDENDVLTVPFDISDFDCQPAQVEKVIDKFGKVDILVNNAGRTQRAKFEEIEYKVDQAMFNINVLGSVVLTRLLIPHFRNQGHGHVVVTSSVAGKLGAPHSASYSGTKFALHGYFESLRAELGAYNIKVTLICPGPVFSNLLEKAFTEKEKKLVQGKMNPMDKRMATSRCAYLSAIAIANDLDEVWISRQPILFVIYLSQYLPTIYRRVILKYLFTIELANKLREGKM